VKIALNVSFNCIKKLIAKFSENLLFGYEHTFSGKTVNPQTSGVLVPRLWKGCEARRTKVS